MFLLLPLHEHQVHFGDLVVHLIIIAILQGVSSSAYRNLISYVHIDKTARLVFMDASMNQTRMFIGLEAQKAGDWLITRSSQLVT
jgi:Tfp pilus assembly protein PilE